MTTCAALIVAAGSGSRFNREIPKQYHKLGDETVLRKTVKAFLNHPLIDAVEVVINPAFVDLYLESAEGLDVLPYTVGGVTRQESVLNGLRALTANFAESDPPDFVMIHDGARPLIQEAAITDALNALDVNTPVGAIVAQKITDTVKKSISSEDADYALIAETIDRSSLWLAQTPQAFRFADILVCHEKAAKEPDDVKELFTDDASLAEKYGIPVKLINNNTENFKITTPEDLERAVKLL
ncbi:MAG: 2-C-methyl-D-erythritol 4-phosphate cytidylyltransferase [Alphaproteobacteria bacterium]|nr:2-C-methyl-D-erythritol 4-phosphate cytidylyltransferase [Alphaproteobacteria bacterium]MCL2504657.1 2-C-methyl-D-erythritol 4-phosphate cytidylyltransferase [Alphaproteobacteria bacterium]